ncbi:putative deoxyribonuclease YcfH / radical SAM domain protein [Candidatus Kuenenia stuttgartiensis]|uniref:Putative deoxyribonuclease YcfH / radical SAM domain protein n=2 Tax=Candidatus Brocadiaceae TaxID=1127830 RepID=A0A6G7GP68_KUEST|nr:putative deoxyribonuclease YcfH / radical SAM domain protein [Candidatus Kuenenia stuttgartiensis]GJQ49098.1 MAG: radical SAM protein [Candidatus Kuenenia stuttgartiensis]
MFLSGAFLVKNFNNMMIIDTHAHLDFPEYKTDLDSVLSRAREAGVGSIINVGTSLSTSKKCIALAHRFENIYASVGIHPHSATKVSEETWLELESLIGGSKIVAVGETGLDYYRNKSPHEDQQVLFEKHLALAKKHDLPVIIHCREASEDCLKILNKYKNGGLKGVVHCFSGTAEVAKACLDLGMFLSFAGPITFKNAQNLRDIAKTVPVERLLLETDCPFLSPHPKRGERNEPSYLSLVIPVFAEIYGLSPEDIARITSFNAYALFGIGEPELEGKIAYAIRNSLYINLTNRCSMECSFCMRTTYPFVKGHNLHLKREPTIEEVLQSIGDPGRYDEVVFCGYGEPTERLEVLKAVAADLKSKGKRIRLDTNGHGDIINGRSIANELKGLIDTICISLNAETAEKYAAICKPVFGEKAYFALIQFVKDAKKVIPNVQVSVVEIPGIDIKKCREIAVELGVDFRVRKHDVLG